MVAIIVEESANWNLFEQGQLLIKKCLDERTHVFIGPFFFLERGKKYIKRGRGKRSRLKFY